MPPKFNKSNIHLHINDQAYLRPLTCEDVCQRYIDGLNNPQVHRFLTSAQNTRYTVQSVTDFVDLNHKAEDAILFGLFFNHQLIATARLSDIDDTEAHLGLAIFDVTQWGKGWGTQIISRVSDFAFHELGVQRMVAGIEPENIASIKAFRKCKFKKIDDLWIRHAQ